MNHREEPITRRARKKIGKEIRKAEKDVAAPSVRNLRGQNPAQRPKKVVKREQGKLKTLKKNLTITKKEEIGQAFQTIDPRPRHRIRFLSSPSPY